MTVNKPSTAEEEFFAREEAEKKRRLALSASSALAASERENLRKLHAMHCPKCGLGLHKITLFNVEADRCFHCHGVFLSEGALAKLQSQKGYWERMLRFFARKDFSQDAHE
jgi:uncharacterized protein